MHHNSNLYKFWLFSYLTLPFCPSKYLPYYSIFLLMYISMYLSTYMFICLYVYISICLYFYMSIFLYVYLSISIYSLHNISIFLFFKLCIFPFIYLSILFCRPRRIKVSWIPLSFFGSFQCTDLMKIPKNLMSKHAIYQQLRRQNKG